VCVCIYIYIYIYIMAIAYYIKLNISRLEQNGVGMIVIHVKDSKTGYVISVL